MKCPDCTREMVVNFTNHVCEWCTSEIEDLLLFPGYIVMTDERLHSPHYVFKDMRDAEKWRRYNDLDDATVQKVLSPNRFVWRKSNGSIVGLTTGNRLYYVVPDHRFDLKQPFVFLAPDDYRTRRTAQTQHIEEEPDEEKSEKDRMRDFFFS